MGESSFYPPTPMSVLKQETITFKVDSELAQILASMPNRSEFIRQSILHAIDNACPLCQGSGNLTLQQKRHWDSIVAHYHLERCEDCHTIHEPTEGDCAQES
jgi:hypothetical protein